MARVSIRVKIFYEDVLFVDSEAYLSRRQALKIPGLQVEENQQKTVIPKQPESRSEQKRSSDNDEDEMIDENEEPEDLEMQDQNEQDGDGDGEGDIDIEPSQNIQYVQEDDDDDLDGDISSISRSLSNIGTFGKYKTKRQKRQITNFLELPNKRPRKDNKKVDQATEILKRQQKQRKRKQYIKKMMQAEEKATFEKILNETGRKFKQMQQKELKEQMQKQRKVFRTLGDIPKIITKQNQQSGNLLLLHKTPLFNPQVLRCPQTKMGQICTICEKEAGKYKAKSGKRFCSVKCYKNLQEKQN